MNVVKPMLGFQISTGSGKTNMQMGLTHRTIILLTLLVMLSGFGFGQVERSTQVRGKVFDQMGAVIPETKVTLTDAGQHTHEAVTNENGYYSLNVPPGTYSVKAQYSRHSGWEAFSIENYEVANGVVMNLDIALRVNKAVADRYGIPGIPVLPSDRPITKDEAIDIARRDAIDSSNSLEMYEIQVADEKTNWHVSFIREDKILNGGSFGILIRKKDGKIKKRIQYR